MTLLLRGEPHDQPHQTPIRSKTDSENQELSDVFKGVPVAQFWRMDLQKMQRHKCLENGDCLMARIRTIKPEFWLHEDLSEFAPETHMLAAALLNYADDEGFFKANPKLVKAACCPLRDDSVSVQVMLTELVSIDYIELFTGSDGKMYGLIRKFTQHQIVNRPSASKIKELQSVNKHSLISHGINNEHSQPERKGTGKGKEQGKEPDTPPNPIEGESADNNHPDDKSKPSNDSEPPEDNNVDFAFEKFQVIARQCNLPVPKALNKIRRTKLLARLNQHGIDVWFEALNKIQNSKYLRGEVNGFRATIDFMLAEPSFQKIIEGNFDDQSLTRKEKW